MVVFIRAAGIAGRDRLVKELGLSVVIIFRFEGKEGLTSFRLMFYHM
jgi:hypothetical protein